MIFPFKNTTMWWRYLASRLEFATEIVLVSDLPDADVDLSERFHQRFRQTKGNIAIADVAEEVRNDIIRRCRYLRRLDHRLANRIVSAMWCTVEELVDEHQPDLFLSFVVDRYILDIFDRVLAGRGVRYIGITVGIIPDHVMFMAKGEHTPVRTPSECEVDAAVDLVTRAGFVPSYVPRSKFDLGRFLSLYARFTGRWLAFEALRVLRRRPLDFRYASTHAIDGGYRVRLRDWSVVRTVDQDWHHRVEAVPFDKRVFLALSVTPEAAIDYWVHDYGLVDQEFVAERVASVMGRAGYHLFVKDHPSQFGFRRREFMKKLSRLPNVTIVPYEVPGQRLIHLCAATFTLTGTVGFEAAMADRQAVVSSSAYYAGGGEFLTLKHVADIDELPSMLRDTRPSVASPALRRSLVRHVLAATVPGSYIAGGAYEAWRGFDPGRASHALAAEPLVASLNTYLPLLARQPR